jgi:hypothetical protein
MNTGTGTNVDLPFDLFASSPHQRGEGGVLWQIPVPVMIIIIKPIVPCVDLPLTSLPAPPTSGVKVGCSESRIRSLLYTKFKLYECPVIQLIHPREALKGKKCVRNRSMTKISHLKTLQYFRLCKLYGMKF